jgi:tetratricopeptide (TPR) repeat protein
MEAWNQAIQRNPDWYYYWLERGLLQETFGNKTEARRDLKESYERLPTQSAEDALKRLGA